uniref:Reverse transcriptase domain-containing protein n=2 Tax=Fagus sylvatica TaxID=28930 RepID=A0A2N9ESQ0_FAGSY
MEEDGGDVSEQEEDDEPPEDGEVVIKFPHKPLYFTSPQLPPTSSSEISLRPHLPKSKAGNDKHSMGGVSVVQNISKLEDSAGRSVHSDRRRCDRADPKGPTPRVGLDSLSTKSSLSAIARAEICPISRGGLLCNTAGIRREEGDAINPNSLQLGVLNPCFRKALLDTLHINNPEILILTETRLGGDRATELARSFPFDGFLCTNTIGFAGGIWILWKTEVVEVDHLCSTEQEIHASVKVRGSNSLWLISAIYGSLRRRANKIVRLKNSVGEWIIDNDLIRLHIQQGPLKLLGLMDYIRGFSKSVGLTVGELVVNEVRQIFSTGKMPKYLNRILISLIPKCLGPETPSQFRPISLCNTVYKIVTKIIVCRLRPIMGNLVSPFQAAFVSDRRGLDNVVIAQELIHSSNRKKGRLGPLILKLDLEKAYDHLEWGFIREVLTFFKFPPPFVDLVLECVTTSSFSVLVNGGQLESFKPSRGIRQRDPLSPYLFKLCMEYLSLKILEACDNNSWKAIKASKNGPSFSHLLLADDLLLCAEASSNCCSTIEFSRIFASNLVKSTQNLGKYLGFPLRPNGSSTRDFDFVVEKVQAKLSSWKAKLLSPAGKVILVQFVTSAIPAYYMQNVALPIRVCSNLDKLNRDFLWGSTDERKKMHMAKTLIAKYYPNGIMDERLETRRSGSSNWKSLKKGHKVFRKGLRWVVNNGHEISFWHDLWVGDSPLRSLVHGPLSSWEDSLRVCDVVEGVSMWNLSTLSLDIPTCPREAIKAISVCSNRPLADKRVWDTVGGEFKLGLAGGGGVIRNHVGDWVGSFSRTIGVTTSIQAKLRALKDGLNLAIDLRILHLEIEMDSLVAVELVKSITTPNAFFSTIVTDCRSLMKRFEICSLKHIFREANGCADLLAKAGCDQTPDFISFPNALAYVLEALALDISNATRFRLISS